MTLSHGLRRLATVLEHLESNGIAVHDVATGDDEADGLTVDLTVTVPLDRPFPATVTDDERADAPESDTAGAEESETSDGVIRERVLDPIAVRADATNGATPVQSDAEADGDEAVETTSPADESASDAVVDCPAADCDATFETDHGMKIHRTKVHGDDDAETADAPAYRDPDRLREVFDACDSFTEMRAALETDVSTQTVRRQMIAHDIYEPGASGAGSSSSSSGDGDETEADRAADPSDERVGEESEEPTTERDADDEASEDDESADDELELSAIELPEGVTVADLRSGVSGAQTLYDVQQRFDLEREAAMGLLERYDLLDVVHGRVSDRDRRKQVDAEEITRRILEHAPVTRPTQA